MTPLGIFLPDTKDLSLYFTDSKVTSDFIVDRLEQWWGQKQAEHPKVDTLLLDPDNGPENQSRRSQFIYRSVPFAQATQLKVVLAYYPPHHSKYDPVERCWGVSEVYWNGALLNSEAAVLGFAAGMTYAGKNPHPYRIEQKHEKGVRRTKGEMRALELRLERNQDLPKWFVTIAPPKAGETILTLGFASRPPFCFTAHSP